MKKYKPRTVFYLVLIFLLISVTSCKKGDPVTPPDNNKEYFDFSTTANYTLNINYKLKHNSPITFLVFDEYPLIKSSDDPDLEIFNQNLNPILKGIAINGGNYSSVVNLKKTVKVLYVYTTTIGVPQLLKSSFANNVFTIDAESESSFIVTGSINSPDTPAESNSSTLFAQNADIPGYRTLGSWNSIGTPSYLLSPPASLTAEFLNDINASLPEYSRVPQKNPEYIANGVNAALHIIAPAKVEVVFVHEGASYKNVLGYFHYPTTNPPTKLSDINKIIAFPNMSYPGSGGNLSSGSRVLLRYWNGSSMQDVFPAGVSIGWFIISNGFTNNGSINASAPHFYSLQQFNPEVNPLLRAHNVLLYDPARSIVLIGFEDINREARSDEDFNDAIFYASATPETAIQYTNLPIIKKTNDRDGDGIPDDRDEFPDEAGVAYANHFPSQDKFYSIAFEDLWPSRGDYDMNDVVVAYNSTHYLNNQNQITKIKDRFNPVWSGGGLDVGFGYQLGIASSMVSGVKTTSDYTDNSFRYKLNANGTEQGQSKATIMVFDNITAMGLKQGVRPQFSIETTLSSPVTLAQLTTPPYNPFIVINRSRGMEVHLPNYSPTDLADKSLLGTAHDRSLPAKGRYYVSDDQMPFAILIPGDFDIPTESVNIGVYYPKFLQWAKSFGVEYPDWYNYKK